MLKETLLTTLVLASTSVAIAKDQIVARTSRKPFVLMSPVEFNNPNRYLWCEPIDENADGKPDSSLVTLKLDGAIASDNNGISTSHGIGLIQNSYIKNVIKDESGKVCETVRLIEEETSETFGALHGTFSSVVKVSNGKLVEDLVVFVGDRNFEGQTGAQLKLRARVEKPIGSK